MSHLSPSDADLARFFDQAADIEPPRLPSAGQLRWRAEIAARMTADEHRADAIRRPVLIGLCLASVPVATALLFAFAGVVPSEAALPLAVLVTTPFVPVGLFLVGLALVAVLSLLARPNSRAG